MGKISRQAAETMPPDAANRLGKRSDMPKHPAISARSIVAVELFYWANAFGQKLVGRAAIQQVDDGDDRTQRKPRRHAPERALDAGELAFVRSKPLGRMDCQLAAVFRDRKSTRLNSSH